MEAAAELRLNPRIPFPARGSTDRAGQVRLVHDGDAGGRLKVKLGLGQGDVFLPVAEAKLGLNIACLPNQDADQTAGCIHLKKNLADGFTRGAGVTAGQTAQERIAARPGLRAELKVASRLDEGKGAAKTGEI
jgi:hypothetical protein